jgi:NAD(P)-dependent dehydrogenase (short-subunit alcohol dehydrogenase family)
VLALPTVLITGASRGLGLEFVRQYTADGWSVVACCRTPAKAEALKALATQHSSLRIEQLDVANDVALQALTGKLEGTAIDVLINNAGIAAAPDEVFDPDQNDPRRNFGSAVPDVLMGVLRVNTVAPLMVAQAFLPHLQQGQQRKIIMISSRLGSFEMMQVKGARNMAYRISKSALNMGMRCAAITLEPEGFVVASLHPGWVKTDMGGAGADITPEQSISGMRRVIESLTLKNSGQFLNYNGDVIPW